MPSTAVPAVPAVPAAAGVSSLHTAQRHEFRAEQVVTSSRTLIVSAAGPARMRSTVYPLPVPTHLHGRQSHLCPTWKTQLCITLSNLKTRRWEIVPARLTDVEANVQEQNRKKSKDAALGEAKTSYRQYEGEKTHFTCMPNRKHEATNRRQFTKARREQFVPRCRQHHGAAAQFAPWGTRERKKPIKYIANRWRTEAHRPPGTRDKGAYNHDGEFSTHIKENH